MQPSFPRRRLGLVILAGLVTLVALHSRSERAQTADPKVPDAAAVERTRATVKLLDDVHKGYVIAITATYVRAQEVTPAATVAKKLFAHLQKNGHGTTRLIDATGKPFLAENVARSDFEKQAVAAIKGGKAYVDEVGVKDGKPVLRAATLVPAVMPQCSTCHPHVKQGDVMGALIYELPIRQALGQWLSRIIHRKDAKDAREKETEQYRRSERFRFLILLDVFLCVLCVFAVNYPG